MVLLVAGLSVSGLVIAAVATNLIKLGPSTVRLPDPPLTLDAVWYRVPDIDPEKDYYAILVTVANLADDPNILPYSIVVNVTVIGAQVVSGAFPQAGDHARMDSQTFDYGESRPLVVVDGPAGYVNTYEGDSYFVWTVVGKRGLESQPVFTASADFYLDTVVLPENVTLEAHPEVLLTWYYANALQAYSVATRGANVVCNYVPPPGSEGTGPYSSCA